MLFKILNPYFFTSLSRKLLPFLFSAMALLITWGLYQALWVSPEDYQQGEMVRIMYIHVPAAWMSLAIYTFITCCSVSNLVWKTPMSFIMAIAAAPIGAVFALITLVTGSLWGKPIWGTWWVWDARLTSMLVLFLLYLSYIAVASSGDNMLRAAKPASCIALIGFINIPIVKFSVNIWYSLHQPASIFRLGGPTIHSSMLLPLILMLASFILYFGVIFILRIHILLNYLQLSKKNIEVG